MRPCRLVLLGWLTASALAQTVNPGGPLGDARKALARGQYAQARTAFAGLLQQHPADTEARLGLADAELALHHYEAAELDYRQVVFAQPELWIAHKNLVIVEAALGRWDEFDRERALLRAARDRAAPGIRRDDADVIDTFDLPATPIAPATHWIVRDYYQPLGRTQARYNFESFTPDGRIRAYISLESAALPPANPAAPIVIGTQPAPQPASTTASQPASTTASQPASTTTSQPAPAASSEPPVPPHFTLNVYTATGHGVIARYPGAEPTYERVRSDVRHWLRTHPTSTHPTASNLTKP